MVHRPANAVGRAWHCQAEGTTAGAIRGLPLTADDYETAKNIIKKRFINAHKERLVNIAGANSVSNLKRLTEPYDKVKAHIRALSALAVENESCGKYPFGWRNY